MSSEREKLLEILDTFTAGMLVTQDDQRRLRSRPMLLAGLNDDGDVYLIAGSDDPKVRESQVHPNVNFSCQDGTAKFVSVTGTARIVNDENRLQSLWKTEFEAWFPNGPTDPAVVLFVIEAEYGEYWESGMLDQAKLLLETAASYVTGEPPTDHTEHGKAYL